MRKQKSKCDRTIDLIGNFKHKIKKSRIYFLFFDEEKCDSSFI